MDLEVAERAKTLNECILIGTNTVHRIVQFLNIEIQTGRQQCTQNRLEFATRLRTNVLIQIASEVSFVLALDLLQGEIQYLKFEVINIFNQNQT